MNFNPTNILKKKKWIKRLLIHFFYKVYKRIVRFSAYRIPDHKPHNGIHRQERIRINHFRYTHNILHFALTGNHDQHLTRLSRIPSLTIHHGNTAS